MAKVEDGHIVISALGLFATGVLALVLLIGHSIAIKETMHASKECSNTCYPKDYYFEPEGSAAGINPGLAYKCNCTDEWQEERK